MKQHINLKSIIKSQKWDINLTEQEKHKLNNIKKIKEK